MIRVTDPLSLEEILDEADRDDFTLEIEFEIHWQDLVKAGRDFHDYLDELVEDTNWIVDFDWIRFDSVTNEYALIMARLTFDYDLFDGED